MKIGKKIKKIRIDNGWSQEAISSNAGYSQSTIASIEKDNMNPSEKAVRALADALETYYDDLIEGTDWKSDDKKNDRVSYALSISEVKVSIDDNGRWDYQHLSYSIKDRKGGENKFSPITGDALIYECGDCKRPINRPEHKYCMGCGKNLIPDFQVFDDIKETMTMHPYMTDPRAAEDCLSHLTGHSSYYNDLIRRAKIFQDIINNNMMDEKEMKGLEKAAKSTGISSDIKSEAFKNMSGLFSELIKMDLHIMNYGDDFSKIDIEPIVKTLEFNISIVEGLIKKMYSFMHKNSSVKSYEAIRLELYARLADKIDEISNSLAIDLEKDPALEKISGINEETRANRVKEKLETLNQLEEMFQNLDDVKDETHKDINNLINKASTLSDEKISNDLDEDKSESTENNDSSSIKDEKSKDNKKKGA